MGKKRWLLIVGIIIMAFLIFVPELGGTGEHEPAQKPEAGPVESVVTQAPASLTPNPVIEPAHCQPAGAAGGRRAGLTGG